MGNVLGAHRNGYLDLLRSYQRLKFEKIRRISGGVVSKQLMYKVLFSKRSCGVGVKVRSASLKLARIRSIVPANTLTEPLPTAT